MSHTEQTLFVLSTHKVPQKHKTDFTQQQVMLLDELNCRLCDFSHDVEGFEDDDHGEQIMDLVLASHGWEWEEFYKKFVS
jgi:hypothetical protein